MPRPTPKATFSKLCNKAVIDLAQANNYYQESKYKQARKNLMAVVMAMDEQAAILANKI